LAASEYDSYTARLAQLAGLGQSATAGTAAAGSSATNNISNALDRFWQRSSLELRQHGIGDQFRPQQHHDRLSDAGHVEARPRRQQHRIYLMAAVGPYGIEQFDASGIIGAYQNAQQNRIRMMYEQKQLEQLDRQTKNEAAVQKAVAAYYSNSRLRLRHSPLQRLRRPADPLAPLPDQPTATAASQPDPAARQRLISTLLAIDAPTAEKYMNVFSAMDKSQAEQVALRNTHAMQIMGGLLQLPLAQRQTAIQQAAPELEQLGYTPQQVAGFVPSDENLRSELAKHMDANKLITFVKPEINAVTQGGSLVQSTPSGQTKTLYETPTVAGPNGEVFPRPGAMSTAIPTVQTPQEAAKLPPGTRFKLPDGRIGTVPGGAGGNASGGFQ
jgi:hypothetical protein